jgi:hypothetical protein
LSEERRVHLSEVIEKLPDKIYSKLEDVIEEMRAVL